MTITAMVLAVLIIASPLAFHAFRTWSPENRLLVQVISCRLKGCTDLFADFHDYGGLNKVPGFVRIAKGARRVTLNIFELEDITALASLPELEEVDIVGAARVPEGQIRELEDRGVIVHR